MGQTLHRQRNYRQLTIPLASGIDPNALYAVARTEKEWERIEARRAAEHAKRMRKQQYGKWIRTRRAH